MSAISALISAWADQLVDDVGHVSDGTTPAGFRCACAFTERKDPVEDPE